MSNTSHNKSWKTSVRGLLTYAGFVALAVVVASGAAYLVVNREIEHRGKITRQRDTAEKDFQTWLAQYVTNAKSSGNESALFRIKKLARTDTNPEHQTLLGIALAELSAYCMEIEPNPAMRELLANETIAHYNNILPKLDMKKKNEISRKLATVHMEQGKWEDAAKIFKESEDFQMTPIERWNNRLSWSSCLSNLGGKTQQALDLLSQIVEECDNRQLQGKALRMKADILLAASISPDDSRALAVNREYAGADERPAILSEKAFELYTQVAKILPSLNDDVGASQLGMLKILIKKGAKDDAYDIVNKIQFGGSSSNDKIRSLLMIAQMEEDDGNIIKAAEILSTCKRKHADSALSDELAFRLYGLMLKNKNWDEAFDLAEEILVKYHDLNTLTKVVKGFFPGDDNLIDHLDFTDKDRAYKERATGALKALESRPKQMWQKLEPYMTTAMAFLNYQIGQSDKSDHVKYFELAEKNFAELIENRKIVDLLAPDDILYHDLMSAVNSGKNAPVVALRARRYLHELPLQGKHSRDTLQLLMGAYYQMGLYDQAFDIARNVFIEQVSQVGGTAKSESSDEWLKTVAKIGQCYDKLGQHEKSNTILRNYSKRFLSRPFAAQIYYDWAGVALARGQRHEAIRRYDVAFPRADTPDLKYKIMLSRCVLALELEEDENAYPEGLALIDRITTDESLKPEPQKDMLRKLYEAMLAYSIAHDKKEFERLFNNALVAFKDDTWPEYWVLRHFAPMFGKAEMSEISKRHKEMLDNEFLKMAKTTETFTFLKRQLDLIQKQIGIEGSLGKLKNKGL